MGNLGDIAAYSRAHRNDANVDMLIEPVRRALAETMPETRSWNEGQFRRYILSSLRVIGEAQDTLELYGRMMPQYRSATTPITGGFELLPYELRQRCEQANLEIGRIPQIVIDQLHELARGPRVQIQQEINTDLQIRPTTGNNYVASIRTLPPGIRREEVTVFIFGFETQAASGGGYRDLLIDPETFNTGRRYIGEFVSNVTLSDGRDIGPAYVRIDRDTQRIITDDFGRINPSNVLTTVRMDQNGRPRVLIQNPYLTEQIRREESEGGFSPSYLRSSLEVPIPVAPHGDIFLGGIPYFPRR
jgi:hypothetical protein